MAGDLRWAGTFGVNVDFVARSHCSVALISLEDIQVMHCIDTRKEMRNLSSSIRNPFVCHELQFQIIQHRAGEQKLGTCKGESNHDSWFPL